MGWTYNTRDPDASTIGPLITGVSTALTFISLVTVCLRVYVRTAMIKAFGVDDYIIVITWVCAAGFAIVTILQTKWGLGLKNIEDLPAENIYDFGLLQYMGAPLSVLFPLGHPALRSLTDDTDLGIHNSYISSILGFKLALLFSYLRFIPKGVYRYITIGVIVACVLFHLSFLVVQVNLCQPIALQWDPSIKEGSCIKGVPFYTSMASLTIVFDVIVMLTPFPVLVKSRIQNRKKLVLLGLFGLGLFITVIQIIRIQTVKQLVNYVDSAPLILWSAVENNLGIIVANVPTLAPLVKYYNEKSTGGSGMRSKKTGYASQDIGSRYAMRTWKSHRSKALELGSVHDATDGTGSFEGHVVKGNNSTEMILDHELGITKKVEVVITRN
ncbi:hypothetical protein B0T21DRAFT_348933 [Apiosordaria backusii]|uniref:Rhodopsin domain-containing protein n=1 Tax=Apiosordaria backusii TaxID=314023 RepID=A0AA40BJT9_9PEZI|nr:hypothetical protein B0T21DRAFT_348933 [Apiosordaria backusii]